MLDDAAASHPDPTPAPGSLRLPKGRGRPYPPEVAAAVRALVERTALRFAEIASRTGAGEATVARWTRRFGWARPGAGRAGSAGIAAGTVRPVATSRRPGAGRYGPSDHEAARVLVEGSRLGFERIGLALGIGAATLFRWRKRFRWQRPSRPGSGPMFYRSRRRGRPYSADAVGTARDLATRTLLPQARIAARAHVSQATVSNWIARRGWIRPAAEPGSRRFAASRRTAPTAESGDRRGRAYGPDTVAEARRLWEQTLLPSSIIAARVKVSAVTVARWARVKGWRTRPRDLPDAYGRPPRRRRRR